MKKTAIGCNNCCTQISREIEVPDDFEIKGWCECERCFVQGRPKVEDIILLIKERVANRIFQQMSPLEQGDEVARLAQDVVNLIVRQRFAKPGHKDRNLILP